MISLEDETIISACSSANRLYIVSPTQLTVYNHHLQRHDQPVPIRYGAKHIDAVTINNDTIIAIATSNGVLCMKYSMKFIEPFDHIHHAFPMCMVRFSSNGQYLVREYITHGSDREMCLIWYIDQVCASLDGHIGVWRIDVNPNVLISYQWSGIGPGFIDRITDMQFTVNLEKGEYQVAIASWNGQISILHRLSSSQQWEFLPIPLSELKTGSLSDTPATLITWSPNGQYLAVVASNSTDVIVKCIESGRSVHQWGLTSSVRGLTSSSTHVHVHDRMRQLHSWAWPPICIDAPIIDPAIGIIISQSVNDWSPIQIELDDKSVEQIPFLSMDRAVNSGTRWIRGRTAWAICIDRVVFVNIGHQWTGVSHSSSVIACSFVSCNDALVTLTGVDNDGQHQATLWSRRDHAFICVTQLRIDGNIEELVGDITSADVRFAIQFQSGNEHNVCIGLYRLVNEKICKVEHIVSCPRRHKSIQRIRALKGDIVGVEEVDYRFRQRLQWWWTFPALSLTYFVPDDKMSNEFLKTFPEAFEKLLSAPSASIIHS